MMQYIIVGRFEKSFKYLNTITGKFENRKKDATIFNDYDMARYYWLTQMNHKQHIRNGCLRAYIANHME